MQSKRRVDWHPAAVKTVAGVDLCVLSLVRGLHPVAPFTRDFANGAQFSSSGRLGLLVRGSGRRGLHPVAPFTRDFANGARCASSGRLGLLVGDGGRLGLGLVRYMCALCLFDGLWCLQRWQAAGPSVV